MELAIASLMWHQLVDFDTHDIKSYIITNSSRHENLDLGSLQLAHISWASIEFSTWIRNYINKL